MTLPRPGGRTLQVAIAGDRAGPAIVLLAFAGQRCFPASFEKQLFEANLQLLSLSPPGYGATSKPNKDEDFAEVACGDYIALLDQLGIEKAVILADGPTLFQAVDFAQRQPDRVQQILTTIPFLPKRFESGVKKKSSFYDYIMAAFSRSSQLRKFAAVALIKAFFKMDVHMFLWAVYKRDPVAFETVIQSGLALEMEAIKANTRQRHSRSNIRIFGIIQRGLPRAPTEMCEWCIEGLQINTFFRRRTHPSRWRFPTYVSYSLHRTGAGGAQCIQCTNRTGH